jgi:hypothetical protein
MILHLTGSRPKQAIVSGLPGDTSTPKLFAMFCNVNTSLSKLSSESAIKTRSPAKKKRLYLE